MRSQEEQLAIGVAGGGHEQEIAASEAALRGIETRLQAARDSPAETTLTAPFDGIVARRNVDPVAQVLAGQDIVLLQDIATLHLAFDLPGTDVPDIGRSPEVQAVPPIFPGGAEAEYPAELVEFSTQPEAITQTYRGRVSITSPEGLVVLPGMAGGGYPRPP